MNKAMFIKHVNGGHHGDLSTQRGKLRLLLKYVYDSVDVSGTYSTFEKFFDYMMGTHEGDFGKQKEAMNLVITYMWNNHFTSDGGTTIVNGFPHATLPPLIDEITGGNEGDLKFRSQKFAKFLEYCWDYLLDDYLTTRFELVGDSITGGDVAPSLSLRLLYDKFVDNTTAVQTASNWTISLTASGLTLSSITKSGDIVTFAFTGTAVAAKALTFTAKADILTSRVNSNTFTHTTLTP